MRNKLSLIIGSLLLAGVANAELGSIKIQSYLYQPLKATIPISNVADGDYVNLTINLADALQYRNQGVPYNTDLGLLQFRVVNAGNKHYLQITSSKPISDPVLNMLLHYREGNNDYYRQYNILLNPIEYSSVGYANSAIANGNGRVNPIAVGKINGKKSKGSTASIFTPSKNSAFVKEYLNRYDEKNQTFRMESGDSLYIPIRFTQELYPRVNLKTNQIAVALGFANYPYLHDKNYIYESTTIINMANAKQITLLPTKEVDQYIWRSKDDSINREMLLSSLASKLKVEIDKNNPNLFISGNSIAAPVMMNKSVDNGIKATINASDTVIVDTNKENSSKDSASTVKPKAAYVPPPVYNEPDLMEMLMDNLYEVAAGLIVFLLVILLMIKKKKAKNKPVTPSPIDETISAKKSGQYDEIVFEDLPTKPVATSTASITQPKTIVENQQPVIANQKADPTIAPELQTSQSVEADFTDNLTVESPVEQATKLLKLPKTEVATPSQYDDIIKALEDIVSVDDSRNDLKLKLLELFLEIGNTTKAIQYADDLDNSLDFNDGMRQSMIDLTAKYGMNFNRSSVHKEEILSSPEQVEEINFEEARQLDFTPSDSPVSFDLSEEVPSSIDLSTTDDAHSIDFASTETTGSFETVEDLVETTDFAMDDSHSISFSTDSTTIEPSLNVATSEEPGSFNPFTNIEDEELATIQEETANAELSNEELIAAAVSNCQEQEFAHAKRQLMQVLMSDEAAGEQKASAIQLMEFYKLND